MIIYINVFYNMLTLIFIEFAELGSYANVAQFNLFTELTIHSMHSFVYVQTSKISNINYWVCCDMDMFIKKTSLNIMNTSLPKDAIWKQDFTETIKQ